MPNPEPPRIAYMLGTLSSKEKKDFLRWISFQKGKEKSDPWRWAQVLIRESSAWIDGKKKKNAVWEETFTQHFPQKSRDRFHKLNEEVNRYLEQFLIWLELDQNSLEKDLILMRAVSQRSPAMMPGILSKVKGRQNRQDRREHSYHQGRRKWLEFRFENAFALPGAYPKNFLSREKQIEIQQAQRLAIALDGIVPFIMEISPIYTPPLSPLSKSILAILESQAEEWPVVKTLYEVLTVLIQSPSEADIKGHEFMLEAFHRQHVEGRFAPYLTLNLGINLHNHLKRISYFHPEVEDRWLSLSIKHYHWLSNHWHFIEDSKGMLNLLAWYGTLIDRKPTAKTRQRLWSEANTVAQQWLERIDPSYRNTGQIFWKNWQAYYQGLKPDFHQLSIELANQSYLGAYMIEVFMIKVRVEAYIVEPTDQEKTSIQQQVRNLIERLGYQSGRTFMASEEALRNFLRMVRGLVNTHSPDGLSSWEVKIKEARPIAEQAWLLKQIEALSLRGYPLSH